MSDTTCCVCFKEDSLIPLTATDSNNDTISSKLQSVVSEVQWKDTFAICPQCLRTLDIVIDFRNLCLKSSSIRIGKEESDSIEDIKDDILKQEESSSEDEDGTSEFNISEGNGETNNVGKNKGVPCNICKIELGSNEHLYTHNKEIHKSDCPYKCIFCDKSFSRKKDLLQHGVNHQTETLKNSQNIFICFHCNKPYKSKVMLIKHIKVKHESRKFQCLCCTEIFNNDISLKKHYNEIHSTNEKILVESGKLFKCSKCGKSYKVEKVMKDHFEICDGVKRHSKINFAKDFTQNKCAKCGRYYTTEKILKAHIKSCKALKPRVHMDLEETKCYICNEKLNGDQEKLEHVFNLHSIDLNIVNTCQYCYTKFLNQEEFEIHLTENHNYIKIQKRKMFTDRSYSCEVCMQVFGYVKELIEHCVKEHNMDSKLVKPFLCDQCDTRFTSSANMIQHKQYHEGNRSHICSYCGKSYITKSDLTVHEYTHLNRRNYKCDLCDRAFNTNKNLRSHKLVVHTDSSLWKYQCSVCERKFPLKSGYDQHVKRHAGDKRFQCLVCQKSFISSSELRKHMTFHSNVRAFKCSHCGKDYKDRRVYEIHLTKVHGIGNAKIPVRVKRFACHVCPSTFFDKHKLTRHLCTHTGVKPYPCTICEKKFTDKSYLKHHLKVAHDIIEVKIDDIDGAKMMQVV